MFCIYRGTGPTDAYLVRDWLERNGLRAEVRGEMLLGVIGQVPIDQSWPSVWVPAVDADRARAALRLFQGPTLVHPEWTCSGCGEVNGAAFGSCWSCGTER